MTEKEFTTEWIEKLKGGALKPFPGQLSSDVKTSQIEMPEKNILMGEELFGSFELIDSEGNPAMVTDSLAKAKYILYGSREKPKTMEIPVDEQKTSEMVRQYEKHLDSLIRDMEKDYNSKFPKLKNFFSVSNNIFNSLNLKRY
ncbi:MAG: hypothetical protein ACM34K_04080 [Bacillota bacterium]